MEEDQVGFVLEDQLVRIILRQIASVEVERFATHRARDTLGHPD